MSETTSTKPRPGETEASFRARAQRESEDAKLAEHNAILNARDERRDREHRSFARRVRERAREMLGFDKGTIAGTMAAMIHEPTVDTMLEYAKIAKRVAQAGDAAKQADRVALAKLAIELDYKPAHVEADIKKLQSFFAKKPELDDLIARRPAIDKTLGEANAKLKAAEKALADAKEELARARTRAHQASVAPSELQQAERDCGDLFLGRDALLAKFAREENLQADAIRRTPSFGVGFAV